MKTSAWMSGAQLGTRSPTSGMMYRSINACRNNADPACATGAGHYFVVQQQELGDVNAFVEESVNGQKVIKVFNHEDATQASFDDRNENACHRRSPRASTPSDRSSSASPSSCGRQPVHRHGDGQHPLWQARRDR